MEKLGYLRTLKWISDWTNGPRVGWSCAGGSGTVELQLEPLKANGKTEVLIAAVIDKLRANHAVLAQAHRGHISWRWDKKGKVEITFKPEL